VTVSPLEHSGRPRSYAIVGNPFFVAGGQSRYNIGTTVARGGS
jgi:hypothetical protein